MTEVEQQKHIPLNSVGILTIDILVGGGFPLTRPVEGFSYRFRRDLRLWRIRGGHLSHAIWAISSFANQDYVMMAANLAIIAAGAVTVAGFPAHFPVRPSRLQRVYTPFLK